MPTKRKKTAETVEDQRVIGASAHPAARRLQSSRTRRIDSVAEMMAKEDARLMARASARALRRGLH